MAKRTALYDEHLKLGAKIVEFAGWDMPVEYSGIKEEHLSVRNSVGIFDVSHMGEVFVSGAESEQFLSFVFSNDVSNLEIGKAQYGYLPNTQGGVVDDIIVYKIAQEFYLLVVNASNVEKDYQWLLLNSKSFEVVVEDKSDDYAQIAVQGPQAMNAVASILPNIQLPTNPFEIISIDSEIYGDFLLSTTGYTGSGGCEIYLKQEFAVHLWTSLLGLDRVNILPVGLGARDTLRLEKGYSLYGHELNDTRSPIESGLGWVTKLANKPDFIAKEIIKTSLVAGTSRKIVGFVTIDRAIPRDGYEVVYNDVVIGHVTSGGFSPVLEKGIGLALVDVEYVKPGTKLDLIIRGRKKKIEVVKNPIV